MDLDTGPEYFVVVDTYPTAVKQAAIMIEDGSLLGQLFTINVFYLEEGKMIEVQRMEIGYEPRKCMICGDQAFECENKNVHTREEIQKNRIHSAGGWESPFGLIGFVNTRISVLDK